jgi:hypothetical protein
MTYISMRAIFLWLFGPIIWAAHLFVLYGATTIICTGASASQYMLIRWVTLALTALALTALLGFVALSLFADREHRFGRGTDVNVFLKRTAIVLAALSVIAILWSAASAILFPTCASAAG